MSDDATAGAGFAGKPRRAPLPLRRAAGRAPLRRVRRSRAGPFPVYTRAERLADLFVHLAGLAAALGLAPLLLRAAAQAGGTGTVLVVSGYLLALVGMLTASASFNAWPPGRIKTRLHKLDHAFIFLKIIAVVGVFTWLGATGERGGVLFLGLAVLTLAGLVHNALEPDHRPLVRLALYLAIGWGSALAAVPLWRTLPPDAFGLLLAGGLVATLGSTAYLAAGRSFHLAIWHGAVVAASLMMALSIGVTLRAGTI